MRILKTWDLQLHCDGPVTEELLAESIADKPGIIWKTWTVENGMNHNGSTYLFRSYDGVQTYKAMHVKRLEASGCHIPLTAAFGPQQDSTHERTNHS